MIIIKPTNDRRGRTDNIEIWWKSPDCNRSNPVLVMMGRHNNFTVEPTNIAYLPLYSPVSTTATTVVTAGRNKNNCNVTGGNCSTGATSTGAPAGAMQYVTAAADQSSSDYYYYYAYDNVTETALFFPLNGTVTGRSDATFDKSNCQWIPAQQSLFQFSNICFLTAFIVPRSYKLSVLSLR